MESWKSTFNWNERLFQNELYIWPWNDVKYIDICIKLLDILIDDGYKLFDYDNHIFLKYVNIRNDNRFNVSKNTYDDIEIYCFDVYIAKVKNLYYEILKNKINNWWD